MERVPGDSTQGFKKEGQVKACGSQKLPGSPGESCLSWEIRKPIHFCSSGQGSIKALNREP